MLTHEELKFLFRRVNNWAMERQSIVPRLRFRVQCPYITATRKKGDKRAFFHVEKGIVCADPAACKLPLHFLVGLFLHEIGHPLATRIYGRSEQWDADRSIKEVLGVKIHYGGPWVLEYVAPSVAKQIIRQG